MIVSFFFLIGFISRGQIKPSSANVVFNVDFDYLEGCENGKGDCKPVILIRHTKEDRITITFPSGGTQSDVYLRSFKNKNLELHDRNISGGKPVLNLTSLDDGEYSARMVSCGLGGSFVVKIITKQR